MREICQNVQIKPTLYQILEPTFQRNVNIAGNARLDSSVGGCGTAVRNHTMM